jgi:hypothetical protein
MPTHLRESLFQPDNPLNGSVCLTKFDLTLLWTDRYRHKRASMVFHLRPAASSGNERLPMLGSQGLKGECMLAALHHVPWF